MISKLSTLTGWTAFLSAIVMKVRLEEVNLNLEAIIVGLTGVIAIVSTLIGVINTAKNDAFKNSQSLVARLQEQVDKLQRESDDESLANKKRVEDLEARIERLRVAQEYEHKYRMWYEDYNRLLLRTLNEHGIQIPKFIDPPSD